MKASTILKRKGIDFNEPVLLITMEEALENLLEATKEYCHNLKINAMTKEDLLTLLHSYGQCVINYHPENDHQERAALIENFGNLLKYGVNEVDYESLDFN